MTKLRSKLVLTIAFAILSGQSLVVATDIRIKVRSPNTSVASPTVTINDVADILGASENQKKRIGALDLDNVQLGQAITISKRQISVRTILSGVSADKFVVDGPENTEVKLMLAESLQARIESKMARELSTQFGIPISDISIRLLDLSVLEAIRSNINTSSFQSMSIFPTKLPLGERSVPVDFSDQSGKRISLKVPVRVVLMKEVIISARSIPRGTIVTTEHVQSVKRPIMDNSIELAGFECVGCVTTRDIAQHEIVSTRFLAEVTRQQKILIKRNDIVDVVLIQGPLRVRLKNAKALSAGARGDTIQLENTSSDRRLSGVVQDASTVIVNNN